MNMGLNLILLGYSIKTIYGARLDDLRCIAALLTDKFGH